jgi:rRNA maturation endonuclease Nob1
LNSFKYLVDKIRSYSLYKVCCPKCGFNNKIAKPQEFCPDCGEKLLLRKEDNYNDSNK